MSGDFFAVLAFAAFWSFVVGLDLACLLSLRRSRVEATARVLWVIWIIAVPVIGAISYFIVQPTREEGEMSPRAWPMNEISLERPRRSENIHR